MLISFLILLGGKFGFVKLSGGALKGGQSPRPAHSIIPSHSPIPIFPPPDSENPKKTPFLVPAEPLFYYIRFPAKKGS